MDEREVLLKLRRQFTESEAVQAVEKELRAARMEIGILKSELQEERDRAEHLSKKYFNLKRKFAEQKRRIKDKALIVSEDAPERIVRKLQRIVDKVRDEV